MKMNLKQSFSHRMKRRLSNFSAAMPLLNLPRNKDLPKKIRTLPKKIFLDVRGTPHKIRALRHATPQKAPYEQKSIILRRLDYSRFSGLTFRTDVVRGDRLQF